MISVIIGAAANVILDPIMIFRLGMGSAGAALATVISQCCMAVYVIVQLRSRKMPIRLGFYKFQLKLSRRITAIGAMSFLITVLDLSLIHI